MKYIVFCTENGKSIAVYPKLVDANALVYRLECSDRANGIYKENRYSVVEVM